MDRPARAEDLVQKKTPVAAERGRPDVAATRAAFEARRPPLDPDRFVFLDETWGKTDMARARGWGPAAERLGERAPHGHRLATTYLAALRSAGLSRPSVVDGAMTGDPFRAWVERHPAPTLRPGDFGVLDDRSSHKVAGIAAAIRPAGAEAVYLPPYRRWLNPVGRVFARAKNEIRKRAPRTKGDCDRPCGESLDWFPPDECRNSVRHAGYSPQQLNRKCSRMSAGRTSRERRTLQVRPTGLG